MLDDNEITESIVLEIVTQYSQDLITRLQQGSHPPQVSSVVDMF